MKKHNFGALTIEKSTLFDSVLQKEYTQFELKAQNGFVIGYFDTEEDAKKGKFDIDGMDFTPDPDAHFS